MILTDEERMKARLFDHMINGQSGLTDLEQDAIISKLKTPNNYGMLERTLDENEMLRIDVLNAIVLVNDIKHDMQTLIRAIQEGSIHNNANFMSLKSKHGVY